MARLTRAEFAEQCGMGSNTLSIYINPSRGKVIVDAQGYIDTDNPINHLFLSKRIAKGKAKKPDAKLPDLTASPQYIPREGKEGDEELPTYEESERRVKYFDSLKREKEVEKLQIEIDKKRGEVIPSELIEPFFLLYSQSLTTEFKNAMDDSLRNISHLYSISITDMADFKGYIITRTNEALNKATDSTIRQLQQLINDYSERRGVGEKAA